MERDQQFIHVCSICWCRFWRRQRMVWSFIIRLEWLVENFVGPLYTGLKPLWERLQRAGIAAPIHPVLIHHALMGATTLLFLNAHELELLEGIDATKRTWIDRHADGMIATFLPGLRK